MPDTETTVAEIKRLRRDADELIQRARDLPSSQEVSTAIMKGQEFVMWLGMELKRIAAANPGLLPNPYPHSKDPASPVIDPTADNLKL